jgi:DNA polymerase III alpha subunit (gram-positive type)
MNLVTEPIVLSKAFYNPQPSDPQWYEYRDSLVFFDLETSGLNRYKNEILQIAAKCGSPGGRPFNAYCKPTKPIPKEISRVNNLMFKYGTLHYRQTAVKSYPLKKALVLFLNYLESLPYKKKVILVAHNVNFDASFLVHNLARYKLVARFEVRVDGFVDTLKMFRTCYPSLYKFNQSFLVNWFMHDEIKTFQPHNAEYDVIYLRRLFFCSLYKRIKFQNLRHFGYRISTYTKDNI